MGIRFLVFAGALLAFATRAGGVSRGRRDSAEEPRHLVERPLRRRQADTLHAPGDLLEPFQRQCEMRAALGRHERVDLVDDHRVDGTQRFARVRGQQQVDRLGRGDQDVGGIALKTRALDRGRVSGAYGDRRHTVGIAARGRAVGDAGERGAEVALDVDGERLQRRKVEHAAAGPGDFVPGALSPSLASAGGGSNISRLMHQRKAVRVLPLPVGREDQRRLAACDRRPALRLRWCRRRERRAEPLRDRRMK